MKTNYKLIGGVLLGLISLFGGSYADHVIERQHWLHFPIWMTCYFIGCASIFLIAHGILFGEKE